MKSRGLTVVYFLMAIYSFTQLYFYFDNLDFTTELFNTLIILLTIIITLIIVASNITVFIIRKKRYLNRK
ncbi:MULTISPECIES: hypothetical protein [Flavobacterium]|uniref:hypothetical protein n=1 Tax=Flavobacterium TaxID=237 RepID=UPI00086D2797|nr:MULTISPECIES: hypothetical protein [Flavobacterium]MBN9285907.1 hypothetical protein [Flavobacterium sp.]ODS85626.1 MAG: hypothetical protein ABS44_14900 [Chryseobacterium sp. SCN 40-13]OJV69591.1 MAG: hypothetical protein BGO42_08815 [Flavobacterium sp. 40-81]